MAGHPTIHSSLTKPALGPLEDEDYNSSTLGVNQTSFAAFPNPVTQSQDAALPGADHAAWEGSVSGSGSRVLLQ